MCTVNVSLIPAIVGIIAALSAVALSLATFRCYLRAKADSIYMAKRRREMESSGIQEYDTRNRGPRSRELWHAYLAKLRE